MCSTPEGWKINGPIAEMNKELKSETEFSDSRSSSGFGRKLQNANDPVSDSSPQISSTYQPGRVQIQQGFSDRSFFDLRYNTIRRVELVVRYVCTTVRIDLPREEPGAKFTKELKVYSIILNSATNDKGSDWTTSDKRKHGNSVCGAVTRSGIAAEGWFHGIQGVGNIQLEHLRDEIMEETLPVELQLAAIPTAEGQPRVVEDVGSIKSKVYGFVNIKA